MLLNNIKRYLLLFLLLTLVSCGGGGGGTNSGSNTGSDDSGSENSAVELVISPVKGPMANARVNVYELDRNNPSLYDANARIDTGLTDANAKLTSTLQLPEGVDLVIEIRGAGSTDLNTGRAPVIPRLYTIVSSESLRNQEPAYVTPLSTLGFNLLQAKVGNGYQIQSVDEELNEINASLQNTLPYEFGDNIDIFRDPVVAPDSDAADDSVFDQITVLRAINEALAASVLESANTNDVVQTIILEEIAAEINNGRFEAFEIEETANGFDISALSQNPLNQFVPNTDISIADISQLILSEADVIGIETSYQARPLPINIARIYDEDRGSGNDDINPNSNDNSPIPLLSRPIISTDNISGSNAIRVTISHSNTNALIFYTLDGSNPTESSILYGGAITLSESSEVKARAFLGGFESSQLASLNINIVAINNGGFLNPPLMVSDFASIANTSMSRDALEDAFGARVRGTRDDGLARISVVNRNGRYWLRQIFDHHTDGTRNWGLAQTGTQFRVDLPSGDFDDIYYAYDIDIPSDMVMTRHAKFGPSLRGGPEITTGGNTADGYNGFSARAAFDSRTHVGEDDPRFYPQGTGAMYIYHVDQNNRNGDIEIAESNGEPRGWSLGQTTRVQVRVKMNTPETSQGRGNGRNDGILQVWYDGELVIDERDMRWRHDDDIHVDNFFYSASYGGSDDSFATVKRETVWFSDMAISDRPIYYNPPN